MKYIVKKYNGDYSPSYPYKGRDKELALRIATAYIARGARVTLFEREESDDEEGKR